MGTVAGAVFVSWAAARSTPEAVKIAPEPRFRTCTDDGWGTAVVSPPPVSRPPLVTDPEAKRVRGGSAHTQERTRRSNVRYAIENLRRAKSVLRGVRATGVTPVGGRRGGAGGEIRCWAEARQLRGGGRGGQHATVASDPRAHPASLYRQTTPFVPHPRATEKGGSGSASAPHGHPRPCPAHPRSTAHVGSCSVSYPPMLYEGEGEQHCRCQRPCGGKNKNVHLTLPVPSTKPVATGQRHPPANPRLPRPTWSRGRSRRWRA